MSDKIAPKGWEVKRLGDVCSVITDGTHVTPKYIDKGIPFLSVKDLTKGFIDFSNTRFISEAEHKFLTKSNKPLRDDILYTKVGTTGIAKIVDVDNEFSIFVSIALLKIRQDVIFNRYLEYFLNSPFAREQAQKRTRGTANKNFVLSDIKQIEIHFPNSLHEQKRIVTILDDAFESIAKAKENAEKNLKNSKEIFESYLQSVFENKGDGWEECNLEDYIKLIDYRGRTPVKTETGVRLITAKNVKIGYLELEPQEFINENNYDSWMTRGIPNFGDVIFTTEAPLANVAQINTTEKLAFAQRIIVMQPQTNKIDQTFLKYMLVSNPITHLRQIKDNIHIGRVPYVKKSVPNYLTPIDFKNSFLTI